MHAPSLSWDLNGFVQFLFTSFLLILGLLHLVRNTASKYFIVDGGGDDDDDANFDKGIDYLARLSESDRSDMPGVSCSGAGEACFVCGEIGSKKCSGCKAVRYCSGKCQREHWLSGHKKTCKDNHKASGFEGGNFTRIALVPVGGTSIFKQSKKILFPYDEFVRVFDWDKHGFSPCGLLNCGNSCFANVVLQCLTYTRPLVAYLLDRGHRRECRLNDWCFLCEFETHLLRASRGNYPFSPINILSRLPTIGGNLGYGKQEDAHEFMRFAIDTMQSVCLTEFGGEKAVNPSSQETTLIQHIFGGHLQSQVICTNCNKISNQYENMMDLTVEIHGDAASLEECLDQFTVKECLHGDNMYKCDGCNDYVKAWKRLTVRQAPNILTIALKRFQSGRFGKLNKRVTFPETLNLSPYMTEAVNGTDVYKLYAVVVHVDMLNASYFGHYICYIKDFREYWYMIDDCKVVEIELEEVLSQGAYMLLYKRVNARPSYLEPIDTLKNDEQQVVDVTLLEAPVDPVGVSHVEKDLSFVHRDEILKEDTDAVEMMSLKSNSLLVKEVEVYGNAHSNSNENTSGDEQKNGLLSENFLSSNKKRDIDDEDGVNKLISRIMSSNEDSFTEGDVDSLDNLSPPLFNDFSISSEVGLQKPSCIEDAASLKPQSTPVSHPKRPRSKRNNNGVFQRGFLNQKQKPIIHQEKSHWNGSSLSFVTFVPEQLENNLNDVEMVNVIIDDSINFCKREIISDIADENDGDILMSDAEEKTNGFHSGTNGSSHSQ